MVPNLRDGVTPAGSRLICPRSERRFSVPIWVRCNGHCPGWASNLCLRLLCTPCPSGCAARWSSLWTRASVVLSSPQCSSLSHAVVTCLPPRTLLRVWGCPWYLPLDPAGWGSSLLSEAPLCTLQPLAPSFRVVLAEVIGSLHCAPLTVGTIPGPPALHCLLSAGCLLCLENSPLG